MVVLVGWVFLMSEVPLYGELDSIRKILNAPRACSRRRWLLFFFFITLKPRVE